MSKKTSRTLSRDQVIISAQTMTFEADGSTITRGMTDFEIPSQKSPADAADAGLLVQVGSWMGVEQIALRLRHIAANVETHGLVSTDALISRKTADYILLCQATGELYGDLSPRLRKAFEELQAGKIFRRSMGKKS